MITVNFHPITYRSTGASSTGKHSSYSADLMGWQLSIHSHSWRPPTDMFEVIDRYIIKVEIAGMENGEFSVVFDSHILQIKGTRPESTERGAYYQMEIHHGDFFTEVEIPGSIDLEKVEASYDDGFLIISLPKAFPKQITIGDK